MIVEMSDSPEVDYQNFVGANLKSDFILVVVFLVVVGIR